MVVPATGEVVLVPFPFSDLSQAKTFRRRKFARLFALLTRAEATGFSVKSRVAITATHGRFLFLQRISSQAVCWPQALHAQASSSQPMPT
jgi:hypothetical protein